MLESGSFWNSAALLVKTKIHLLFNLLTAEEKFSNSFELSAEMDSIGSEKKRFAPKRDIASTYLDERIPIPRGEDVSLLLKSNENVNRAAYFNLHLPVSI